MSVVLTLGRSAPARSTDLYLDFKHHDISQGRVRVHMWPKAFMVTAAILASPCGLTNKDLAAFLYGDRADGGPERASLCVGRFIGIANTKLALLGMRIEAATGHAYRISYL